MAEYEMPIEEHLKLLVKKFETFETKFGTFETKFGTFETKLETIEQRSATNEERTASIESKLDKALIRLDQTHGIAKLGLEAVEATRESMDKNFEAMRKAQTAETQLLKDVLVDVRKRVEVVERPGTRRRRS